MIGADERAPGMVEDGVRRNPIFAAPADDPRARRPVDVATLIISIAGVVVLGWSYSARGELDERFLDFFVDGTPSWISGLAVIVFFLCGVYVVALVVGVLLFGGGRGAIVRDMLVAAALAFAGTVVAAYAAGGGFPHIVPEFRSQPGYPSFPVLRLAGTVAALRVAGPFLVVPMRRLGARLVVGAALATIVLSYGTVTAALGGLLVGTAAGAAVHVLFGSGQGIPSVGRIRSALSAAGVDAVDIEYLEQQTSGATRVRAELSDGSALLVKVYGRDAADAARASRLWRAIWYSGESGAVTASRKQLAEHEALILLSLERSGLPVVRLVTGTVSSTGDVVLATEWLDAEALADLDPDGVDQALLDGLWSLLEQLHELGVSHGGISMETFVVGEDGLLFADVGTAEVMTTSERVAVDRAQMLVVTALVGGTDRAIDTAVARLAPDDLEAVLPVLQAAVLPRSLQLDARERDVDVDDLRDALAARSDVEQLQLVQVRRVSWGSVLMAALTLFAASALISSLTEIGFETVADQFSTATWSLIAVGFVLAQLTNLGEVMTLGAVIGRPVPLGPTLMYRYASSFVSLAVPSEAGTIAMSIRYQQKLGVSAAAAIAQGPLLTVFSKAFDVILMLITAQFVGRTLDTDNLDLGPAVRLIVIICVLAVLAALVVAIVPRFRNFVLPHIREGLSAVKGSLTDPSRLATLAGGTLLQKILFAMALTATATAFGADLPFASAVFVNSIVSLFIGFMPVPGGIGVGEAALAAGLSAVGVPPEIALATAITHRMGTSYLPPVFGWWASRWLVARSYL